MLTEVILEGPLGKQFGREWKFDIQSPAEALRMIEVNKPGVFKWIRDNLQKYENYRVVCEYENGATEDLDKDAYAMVGKPTKIRFVPLAQGAGATARIIAGVVIIALMWWNPMGWAAGGAMMGAGYAVGASLVIGGVAEMLAPKPSNEQKGNSSNVRSYFFDGPSNNAMQGDPVPLIYGRIKVGAQAISSRITIDQLM